MLEVKRLRQAREWNQTQLAYHAGLAPSVISEIENGKRDPTARTLRKLARALGVEVRDLFPEPQRRLSPPTPRPADFPFDAVEIAREAYAEMGADTEEEIFRVLDRRFVDELADWSEEDLEAARDWAHRDVVYALAKMPASRAELMRAQWERYAASVALLALDRAELPELAPTA